MKELTIEQKAKAYDKALKLARDYYEDKNCFKYLKGVLENIFPELKESKDERIRKALIDFFQDWHKTKPSRWSIPVSDVITWLEKQGESDEIKVKEFLINKGYPIDANGTFPTYEEMYNIISEGLEKQVEKPQGKTALEAIMEEKSPVESLSISPEKYEEIINECIYGEEKSVDEQKFHEGDWVVNKLGDSWHIDNFDKKNYQVSDGKGNYNWFPISKQDEMHYWTIQDAKLGDVLTNKANDAILIFKTIQDNYRFSSYCDYFVNTFRAKQFLQWASSSFIPATQEQRDFLFAKMKEAGYEWDAEKKELRNIE